MRLFTAIAFLGLFGVQVLLPASSPPLKLTYRFSHTFERRNPNRAALVRVALPGDETGKQEIHSLVFRPEPTRILEYGDRKYAEWVWNSVKNPIVLHVQVNATLLEHDIHSKPEAPMPQLPAEVVKAYVQAEPYLETLNPQIIALADSLPESNSPAETALHILHTVATRLRYKGYDPVDQGAAKALRAGKGDCTEYTDLFVALCRAKGIPARSRIGILHNAKKMPLHSVAEVYLPQQGWVSVDPLDYDRNGTLKPVRMLYLPTLRNDLTLFGYFADKAYMIHDLGEQGPLFTKVSIQRSGSATSKEFTY